MTTCSLTLQPYGKPSFSIEVLENDGRKSSIEQIITKSPDVCVFSDLSYEFALSCEETIVVQDVNVYINDVHEPSVYNNGRIMFPGEVRAIGVYLWIAMVLWRFRLLFLITMVMSISILPNIFQFWCGMENSITQ